MNRDAEKLGAGGFTLLELLVSLTVFSLLMTTAAYSLRMAGTLLHKTDERFAQETRSLSRLRDSIGSSHFFVGERRAATPAGREYYYHFFGTEQELEYVTGRPFHGESLTLSRLRFREGTLLLEEAPIYSLKHDFKQPALPASAQSPTVVINDLETFRIEYFSAGKRTAFIKETLPDAVMMTYKKPNMAAARELYIAVRSNFSDKKDLMEKLAPLVRGL